MRKDKFEIIKSVYSVRDYEENSLKTLKTNGE